jgi:hypothetical protein
MGDTLHTIIETINNTEVNGINLINKVDSFYKSAWDKLILIGSIAFGVIGIIVPYVIQWYQKKTLKISEELLKKEIENTTLKLKSEILSEVNFTIEERIKSFEDKIKKLNLTTKASTLHLQGIQRLTSDTHANAMADFINAAQLYLICEDFSNLQVLLKAISETCLAKLCLEEIEDIKISHNADLEKLLTELDKKNNNGMFSLIIREIRLKLKKLPKIIKDKPTQGKTNI